jgi:hypothetical protein
MVYEGPSNVILHIPPHATLLTSKYSHHPSMGLRTMENSYNVGVRADVGCDSCRDYCTPQILQLFTSFMNV